MSDARLAAAVCFGSEAVHDLGDELLRKKWNDLMTQSVMVTDLELEKVFRDRTEKTSLDYVVIASADQDIDTDVGDSELSSWYDAHPQDYQRDPGRQVRFVVIDREALAAMAAGARGADLLLTSGGASVGDHDLVQSVLGEIGFELDFWKIAMRPGKPLIFGHVGDTPVLGLPGNPVSALVCSMLFLRPALARMLGMAASGGEHRLTARLTEPLGENDERQDYLRGALANDDDGELLVTPFTRQDSSMLNRLAQADCLVVRRPLAPPLAAGERIPVIPIPGGLFKA